MNIIAIDCGASFVKGALFVNGICKKNCRQKTPCVSQNINNFNKQIDGSVRVVRNLLEYLSDGIDKAGLAISNEMHGFILAKDSGEPLTDYISWQNEFGHKDVNGANALSLLKSSGLDRDILKTGMPLRAGLPITNLLYLSLVGALDNIKDDVYCLTLGDFVVQTLSGQVPCCHPTNAAATGFYDIEAGRWCQTLVETSISGNSHIQMPRIGKTPLFFKLFNTDFTVLPAIGDQQAALLGAGFFESGELSFNMGTGGQVSVISNKIVFSDQYQVRPYFDGRFINTIPHIPSGRAINVYIRFIQDVLKTFGIEVEESKIWNAVLNPALYTSDSELVADMSFFENAITSETNGSLKNISEYGLNVGTLFSAIFNQVADNYFEKAKILIKSDDVKRILFSGGLARKVGYIRNRIQSKYKDGVKISVSETDTLDGLNRYYCKEMF